MVRGTGVVLKSLQWVLRAVELGCAAVVLGIYSYFLATLHNHGLTINQYIRSIEGLSGGAVLYTLLALLFLCCLGGLPVFAFLAFLLDILFVGAFIYIAYENRHGANSCRGDVVTVFGTGNTNTDNTVTAPQGGVTLLPSFHEACRLETAVFAVSIIAIAFFLISALLEIALWRHHRAETKYGPSPANNYTAGAGTRRRFWQRNNHGTRDAELAAGAGGLAAEKHHHHQHSDSRDVRPSYATDNTAVGTGPEPGAYKYGNQGAGVGAGNGVGVAQEYPAPLHNGGDANLAGNHNHGVGNISHYANPTPAAQYHNTTTGTATNY